MTPLAMIWAGLKLFAPTATGLASGGGILVAIFLAYQAIAWSNYNEGHRTGYTAALDDIREQNRVAGESAAGAVDRIRACLASGGMWRQASGRCEH